MSVGLKMVAEVRKDIPKSMNYASTSSPTTVGGSVYHSGTYDDTQAFSSMHDDVIEKLKNANYNAFMKTDKNRTLVREVHDIISGNDTGNCLELAFYTAHKLKKKGKRVDVVRVKTVNNGDPTDTSVIPHWFAVLGRSHGGNDNKSIIGLPNTWGPQAVIVDSWDTSVYPGGKYNLFWDGLKAAAYNKPITCELWCRI